MAEILIRSYHPEDERQILDLWIESGLVVPLNNPQRDIKRKLKVNHELLLVGVLGNKVVATCMAGYEGHRGWINYLAVSPEYRRRGFATALMKAAEDKLRKMGCPKINVQIRASNQEVIRFYESVGFSDDQVVSMGKRLEYDQPYHSRSKIRHR